MGWGMVQGLVHPREHGLTPVLPRPLQTEFILHFRITAFPSLGKGSDFQPFLVCGPLANFKHFQGPPIDALAGHFKGSK